MTLNVNLYFLLFLVYSVYINIFYIHWLPNVNYYCCELYIFNSVDRKMVEGNTWETGEVLQESFKLAEGPMSLWSSQWKRQVILKSWRRYF